jgi:hypothetical protein
MSGSRPEGDQRKSPNEPTAVVLGPTISPAEESAENPANQRSHEPVSEFVVTYDVDCFFFTQKAVRCLKVPGADDYLFVRGDLDIAKPVGIPAKTTHHHRFRPSSSVLHDFQDRLMADARASASVRQQWGRHFGYRASCFQNDFVVHLQKRRVELEHENRGGSAIQESAGICGKPTERGSSREAGNASGHTRVGRCEIRTALMR